MRENFFVTAIGTDSGKTLVSAIITQMLGCDYWKPIQAGYPRDTETVRSLVSNSASVFHPEAHLLNTPASPHASARFDGIEIDIKDIKIPQTENSLVIEGAGGCLVPINDDQVVADLIPQFRSRVILVANLYLGSINHTLLTAEYLHNKGYSVKGIIFNGEENEESQRIILKKTQLKCLLHVKQEQSVDEAMVSKYAELLSNNW
ncbi:MAG: dethiobiotin synthase [Cyclobacteriaceae bacterium]|nr:dethiobiotin synthase [Cyclobacteriaceae bacterium SS2]